MEGLWMIVFDRLWRTMEAKGVSTYTLREEYGFHTDTISNLRHNQNVKTKTLSKLCKILGCPLEDIAEYQQD